MSRYDRQQILPQIGPGGQARLAKSRVLLVGCGALGSTAADLLVRAGIGHVRIVDRDLVELTNLQRQVLFDEQDAAEERPKAVAAAERLHAINREIRIDPIVADLNAGNIESFADVDLIVDGTDNIATRYLINDVAVKREIPWIYGGCVGVEGRVWGIWPSRTGCLRCLFPEPPNPSDMPTCDTAGVLGPAAAVVGALQAATAIRFLVEGPEASHQSKLTILNIWDGNFRQMAFTPPQPDCPCCTHRKFPYLSTNGRDFTTNLCGRNAVQVVSVQRGPEIDLSAAADRWQKLGEVGRTPWFIRCKLSDPSGIDLTLFPDGRLIVRGTSEPMRAASIYARFVGS
jgi:molybdopterin/thiamine biosynthesis adenylyltransferase